MELAPEAALRSWTCREKGLEKRGKSELDPETEGILLERNGAFQREKDPIPAGNFGFMECKTRKEL